MPRGRPKGQRSHLAAGIAQQHPDITYTVRSDIPAPVALPAIPKLPFDSMKPGDSFFMGYDELPKPDIKQLIRRANLRHAGVFIGGEWRMDDGRMGMRIWHAPKETRTFFMSDPPIVFDWSRVLADVHHEGRNRSAFMESASDHLKRLTRGQGCFFQAIPEWPPARIKHKLHHLTHGGRKVYSLEGLDIAMRNVPDGVWAWRLG